MRMSALVCGSTLVASAVAGCARPAAHTTLDDCTAPTGRVTDIVVLTPGSYQVTLVATFGDSAGRATNGHLQLAVPPDSLLTWGGRATPLVGFTDIQLEFVGASTLGEGTSTDPAMPGAIVFQEDQRSAIIRLGSEANRRDVIRFEGAYMVLWVTEARPEGFAGTWSSGEMGPVATGYFCGVAR